MTTQAEIKYRVYIIRLVWGTALLLIGTLLTVAYYPAAGPSTKLYYFGVVYIKSIWFISGFLMLVGEIIIRFLEQLVNLRKG